MAKDTQRISRVAVVVPALNEERTIGRVVRGARKCREIDRVIVVDDGSTDRTAIKARAAGAIVVRHRVNRGVGAALRTGFGKAVRSGCGVIVVMGADDQDSAEEIPRLLAAIRRGNDFVQGSRWIAGGRVVNIPLFRRVTTIVYSILFTLLTGRRITDGTNGFRAFRSGILKRIDIGQKWLDTYELEPYLYYHAVVDGLRVSEVPVTKRYPG